MPRIRKDILDGIIDECPVCLGICITWEHERHPRRWLMECQSCGFAAAESRPRKKDRTTITIRRFGGKP